MSGRQTLVERYIHSMKMASVLDDLNKRPHILRWPWKHLKKVDHLTQSDKVEFMTTWSEYCSETGHLCIQYHLCITPNAWFKVHIMAKKNDRFHSRLNEREWCGFRVSLDSPLALVRILKYPDMGKDRYEELSNEDLIQIVKRTHLMDNCHY